MIDGYRLLDRVTRVAPLGLRFWDDATGSLITDGLVVTAAPQSNPALETPAIVTRSGAFAFIHLPGLREAENGSGDAAFWASRPPTRPFVLQVIDRQSRFQPFQFTLDVPAHGLASLDCGSPPTMEQTGIALYSSPARAVPAAMAVIRADLWDTSAAAPAAWALLEASAAGRVLARSYADQHGRIALIFGYPEPPRFSFGSPPSGSRALADQSWTIELRACYSPRLPVPPIPDLCQVLNQAPAHLYASTSPVLLLTEASLEFGKELILKSQSQSVLEITAQ